MNRDTLGRFIEKRGFVTKFLAVVVFITFALATLMAVLEAYATWRTTHSYQSPIVIELRPPFYTSVEVTEEKQEEQEEEPVALNTWTGTASYYDTTLEGCVGCEPHYNDYGNLYFIMANGETLDDMAKTLAFNYLPMNTEVVVTNLSNGIKTKAMVTDTGGFEKYDRIADLSYATKEILGCEDMCQIRIEAW